MKKKILIIAAGLPRPVKGGTALRFENLFKILSEKYDLYFAVRLKDDNEVKNISLNKDIFKKVLYIKSKRPNLTKKISISINALLHGVPPQSYSMYFKELSKEILAFVNENHIDAIHYDHIEYGYYYKDLRDIKCEHVLVVDDIVSDRYHEEANLSKNNLEKAINYFSYFMYKNFEKKIIKYFNNIITVSCNNSEKISKINNCNIGIVANGADLQDGKIIKNNDHKMLNIMFLGSLDYKPNNDAVLFLLKKVIPLMNKINIDYKLYIVGNRASNEIKEYQSENIIITGFVEDLNKYYSMCDIMLAPIFSGGGTRTKILESMAKNTIVISTDKGCEGIEVTNNKNILLANTEDEFVNQILFCMNNKDKKKDIEDSAYQLVMKKYDWKAIGEELIGYYDKLL